MEKCASASSLNQTKNVRKAKEQQERKSTHLVEIREEKRVFFEHFLLEGGGCCGGGVELGHWADVVGLITSRQSQWSFDYGDRESEDLR